MFSLRHYSGGLIACCSVVNSTGILIMFNTVQYDFYIVSVLLHKNYLLGSMVAQL